MRNSIAWPRSSAPAGRREPLPRGDAELRAREIDAGEQLRHRVLDLEARVHLDEVEALVCVHEELDRAGAAVVERFAGLARRVLHLGAQLGRQRRRRRLLHELLVAPLDGALALAEREDAAVPVAEHLDLDVPRADDRALDVERSVREARLGLGGGHVVGGLELAGGGRRAACPCRRRRTLP